MQDVFTKGIKGLQIRLGSCRLAAESAASASSESAPSETAAPASPLSYDQMTFHRATRSASTTRSPPSTTLYRPENLLEFQLKTGSLICLSNWGGSPARYSSRLVHCAYCSVI